MAPLRRPSAGDGRKNEEGFPHSIPGDWWSVGLTLSTNISAERVVTGDGQTVVARGGVRIDEKGRIAGLVDPGALGAADTAGPEVHGGALGEVAGEAARLHFPGCTILPGLVDLHVHVGYWQKKPDASEYDEALIALFAAVNLKEALSLGVTALRDLGSRHGLLQALARAAARNYVVSPRLEWANRLICITGGHSWQLGDSIRETDGPWDLRAAVREQIKTGARWAKLAASGSFEAEYSQEELNAAVDEAHRLGARVAVHSSTPKSIGMCLEAGVDTIEHGTDLTVELAERMAHQGVAWVPTLIAYFRLAEYCRRAAAAPAGERPLDETLRYRCPYFLHAEAAYRANFARLVETGVTVATGTDVVIDGNPISPVADELGFMVELGLPPLRAIEAATSNGARVLGKGEDFGLIAPGRLADLLVVEGNPAEDIGALRRVRAVFLGGRLVHETRGA